MPALANGRTVMEIGTVYYQEFSGGERVYVLPLERCKNGNYRGLVVSKYGRGKNKPKKTTMQQDNPFWREADPTEIPEALRNASTS